MARTRSKGRSHVPSNDTEPTQNPTPFINKIPTPSTSPAKVFVLPAQLSPTAQVVSLYNPRFSKPARYIVCPETGIYEFTRIGSPASTPKSWLLEPCSKERDDSNTTLLLSKSPDLYTATQIDPLFLLLPVLQSANTKKNDEEKRLFLSSDDHLDALCQLSSHLSQVLKWPRIRQLFESAMEAVCDTVQAGDEAMYRINSSKLLETIWKKAEQLASSLPPSMEERFVQSHLEPVRPLTTMATVESDGTKNNIATGPGEPPPNVVRLQRLKVSLDFICSRYLSPQLAQSLKSLIHGPDSPVDFSSLTSYVTNLTKLRQESLAVRAAADYSSKRGLDDCDEPVERMKKRQIEETERKARTTESRGVRELKKVDTKGMKKLSEFFKKK